MIAGWFLITLVILPTGDVDAEVINWYADPQVCIKEAFELKMKDELGIGYTCLEDVVGNDDIRQWRQS